MRTEVRLYRMTRRTQKFVWLRWIAYGPIMRGLSRRLTVEEFRTNYQQFPKKDGLDESLYFRLSIPKIINQII